MKLVISVIYSDDAPKVVDALVKQGFRLTCLTSIGGFLRQGNTTLLSAVEDDEVNKMLEIIRANVTAHLEAPPLPGPGKEMLRGGGTAMVLNLERLEKL